MRYLALLLLLLDAPSGCGPACPPSDRVVDRGERWTAGSERVFQTSGPEGPFLPFEGATLLRVQHNLGLKPHHWTVHLSFSERPLQSGGGGFSSAAGNQATVQRVDDKEIWVKNDSCANYFVRVMVEADERAAADAGADGD